jgi:hypothetical protein
VDDGPAFIVHAEQYVVTRTAGGDWSEGVAVQLMPGPNLGNRLARELGRPLWSES